MNEIAVIVFVMFVLWLVFRPKTWTPPKSKPARAWECAAYRKRQGLFVGRAEAVFFKILKAELPDGYHLFAKVRLEDILTPLPRYKGARFWQLRGRIKSRHVDYLICHQNGDFACAIELDGRSHRTQNAIMVDIFKDKIFQHAGLPLFRVKVGEDFQQFSRRLCRSLRSR